MILVFPCREVSRAWRRRRIWALPMKYFSAASLTADRLGLALGLEDLGLADALGLLDLGPALAVGDRFPGRSVVDGRDLLVLGLERPCSSSPERPWADRFS